MSGMLRENDLDIVEQKVTDLADHWMDGAKAGVDDFITQRLVDTLTPNEAGIWIEGILGTGAAIAGVLLPGPFGKVASILGIVGEIDVSVDKAQEQSKQYDDLKGIPDVKNRIEKRLEKQRKAVYEAGLEIATQEFKKDYRRERSHSDYTGSVEAIETRTAYYLFKPQYIETGKLRTGPKGRPRASTDVNQDAVKTHTLVSLQMATYRERNNSGIPEIFLGGNDRELFLQLFINAMDYWHQVHGHPRLRVWLKTTRRGGAHQTGMHLNSAESQRALEKARAALKGHDKDIKWADNGMVVTDIDGIKVVWRGWEFEFRAGKERAQWSPEFTSETENYRIFTR